MSRNQKRIIAIIILFAFMLILAVLRTPYQIRLYDRAFAQVSPGMNEAQVIQLMGQPVRIDSNADTAFWDDKALPQTVAANVRQQYWYHVSTFYLPISWTIGFDDKGLVVTKHRWD